MQYPSRVRTSTESLTAAGYAVLIFDYRGFGDSGGDRGTLSPPTQLADLINRCADNLSRADTADVLDIGRTDLHDWALAEFRTTSPWAVAQAVAALGRHHSRPWLRRIDVPTAVVVMCRDRVIPAERQRALALRIPGATTHEVDTGHAGCVLSAEAFVPVLVEACASVAARLRDRKRLERRLEL